MTSNADWLPPLVLLADYDGDAAAYLEAVYGYFRQDFVGSQPVYPTKRFALKRHPMTLGKEATFWHLISSGPLEEDRLPDLRRCERIRWPRPMIEAIQGDRLRMWTNERQGHRRIVIAVDDFSYVVVLEERADYVLLWTAYFVEQPHRRGKLRREYEAWLKTQPQKS